MRPDLQRDFIQQVTPESYARVKAELHEWLGFPIAYRVCEMPIFVSEAFRHTLEEAAIDIVRQCVSPSVLEHTKSTLEPRYTVPNEAPRPLFCVVDFAVCKNAEGEFIPKLIELQGFPSLYGYQYVFAEHMQRAYTLSGTPLMGGLDDDAYLTLLKSVLFAGHDKSQCALLEVDPTHQKTRTDFRALEKLVGLQTLDIRTLVKVGRTLCYTLAGSAADGSVAHGTAADVLLHPLKRVFNRAIVDELDDLGVTLPFAWTDDLDIEWAGHPNWYFRISKAVMPWLKHPSVPTTVFLNDVVQLPDDLSSFVLKPLFSFAGKGVILSPTRADIDAIPSQDRHLFVLQERVTYDPCIATPFGDNKVEIRVMLIWPDASESPIPVISLARTGRGALMGARYNTEPWTGSSGCLFV
ncbi:MAG: hypothetical protein SGJ05_08825 [bacterium]|nr:hypothetical protein [bacterium]